jgi:hypothetical protein
MIWKLAVLASPGDVLSLYLLFFISNVRRSSKVTYLAEQTQEYQQNKKNII